jgi:hypothetical protein
MQDSETKNNGAAPKPGSKRPSRKPGATSPSRSVSTPLLLAAVLLTAASPAGAATPEAIKKVDQGIAFYRAGNYKEAASQFDAAAEAEADDLWIAFDRGMAMAAQGESEKAVEFLQKATLSPDFELAVRARYNLGCLAAAKAKKRFGEHPENAAPDVRKEGLEDLAAAVGHFRDCIHLDTNHADARHNLELIRVWIKQMESLWEQMDRKKEREELDLPAYLQMLEEKERALRIASRALADGNAASASRREAQRVAETAQRKLGEEIGPLKEKIEATLTKTSQAAQAGAPGGNAAPAPAPTSEEIKKAIEHLNAIADEAARSIDAAIEQLRGNEPSAAVKPQTETVEKFNQLYRSVVPYPSLVGWAVSSQKGLVDENTPPAAEKAAEAKPKDESAAEKPETQESPATAEPQQNKEPQPKEPQQAASVPSTPPEEPKPSKPLDTAESAWNQEFVTRYAEILSPLAKAGLKQLSAMEAAEPPPGAVPTANNPNTQTAPQTATDPNAQAAPDAGNQDAANQEVANHEAAKKAEEMKKQREDLKRSMEKAVELSPAIEKLSTDAARLLRGSQAAEALPKQQEALKLLQEIADLLPKQKPEDQKKDQDKQDQDKKDQDKQDQNKQDQDKQNQEKKDQEKDKEQEKKEQDKKEQKDQKNQDQKPQEKPKPKDASRQQADAALRQIQDRQQQRQEKEKALQRYLVRPGNVEKDW